MTGHVFIVVAFLSIDVMLLAVILALTIARASENWRLERRRRIGHMAQPKYAVIVKFCIGEYVGEWTGEEPQMEEDSTILCLTPNREYAELLYKRLSSELRADLGNIAGIAQRETIEQANQDLGDKTSCD